MELEEAIKQIETTFDGLPVHLKEQLLSHQFAWKDWKTQSMFVQAYTASIKRGGSRYPAAWKEGTIVHVEEEYLWVENPFFVLLTEWYTEMPKYQFISIGAYLLFFKACLLETPIVMEEMLKYPSTFKKEEAELWYNTLGEPEGWECLVPYFYFKAQEEIERFNGHHP